MYDELILPLFVGGYLIILDTVNPALKGLMFEHLKELMADTELYDWEVIRAYHAGLQQFESGRAD